MRPKASFVILLTAGLMLVLINTAFAQSPRPLPDQTLGALQASLQALNHDLAAAQQSLNAVAATMNTEMTAMREREAATAAWWAKVWRALPAKAASRPMH